MKIKKLLGLLLLLILLTGCTTKVNIDISDNIVKEEIVIDNQNVPLSEFREYIPVYNNDAVVDAEPDIKVDGINYYKKEIKDNKIYYSFDYKLNDYNNSKTMKNFYSSSAIISSDRTGLIEVYTSNDGIYAFDIYPKLTRLEVNITTKLKVEESNADSVKDNTYTWVFTPTNKNKNIYIRMQNYHYKTLHPKKETNNNNNSNNNNNNNNNNSNNNSTSPDPSSDIERYDADIRFKDTEIETEETRNKNNSMLLLITLAIIIGFIFLIFIINMSSNKKNR